MLKMTKKASVLAAGVLATGLLLVSATAGAAFVKTTGDDQQIAEAILNLDVNGTTYTVNFEPTTANDIYGTAPRTYDFGTDSAAQAANDAIIAALNAHLTSEITLVGGLLSSNNSDQYHIGYADNGDVDTVVGKFNDPTASNWGSLGTSPVAADAALIYADFIPGATVPVPAAVWLFGSGLLGLVGMARRKKA